MHLTYQLHIRTASPVWLDVRFAYQLLTKAFDATAVCIGGRSASSLDGHMSADDLISDTAHAAIQLMIVTGRLRGGSMISENELRETLNCGRTPIREALQRLQIEGFVEIHPRRGVLVTTVDIHQQLDLLEVRRPLEDLMVRLAALRASEAERRQMLELADSLEAAVRTGDRERYFGINTHTHAVEARATGNAMLQKTIGQVHLLSRRFWYAFITSDETFSIAAQHHCAVLRAVANGDPEAAAARASDLLDHLEKVTHDTINRTAARPLNY
jgi:DNA-binding GntR family transcriptional regulator